MTCGEFFIAANQEKENNINLRMNQNCISTLNLPLVKEKRVGIGVNHRMNKGYQFTGCIKVN